MSEDLEEIYNAFLNSQVSVWDYRWKTAVAHKSATLIISVEKLYLFTYAETSKIGASTMGKGCLPILETVGTMDRRPLGALRVYP